MVPHTPFTEPLSYESFVVTNLGTLPHPVETEPPHPSPLPIRKLSVPLIVRKVQIKTSERETSPLTVRRMRPTFDYTRTTDGYISDV